jgi:hypothetical protein
MKDFTAPTFGLVIAYLLPGLSAFYGLTFWSKEVKKIFDIFLTTPSNIGLFFLVLLGSLILGLFSTVIRWLLYERWLCRRDRLSTSDFEKLGNEGKLTAFRASVDELYRYHQFYGSMTIVLLIPYVGWLIESLKSISATVVILSLLGFLIGECALGYAAYDVYKQYIKWSRRIMEGE